MTLTSDMSPAAVRRAVLSFSREHFRADVLALDGQEAFNRAGWDQSAELGIMRLPFAPEYGGLGLDVATTVTALEALGRGCPDNGLIFALSAHMWACIGPIAAFGSAELKQRYLPALTAGQRIGCHAATEPEAGSDIFSMQATATRTEDGRYVLDGRKVFVTNAPVADVAIVFARLAHRPGHDGLTAFVVECETPGFTVERKVPKMGLRSAQMGDIALHDCQVPASHRLGEEGAGMTIFNHTMDWERGLILAGAIGSMERVLERTVGFARRRQQFGRPIGQFQAVSHKLAQMRLGIDTSRELLHRVARLKDEGRSSALESAMAKLHISESWVELTLAALQLHGGAGYLIETEIEREVRDALASRIFSGTSELLRDLIARHMGV